MIDHFLATDLFERLVFRVTRLKVDKKIDFEAKKQLGQLFRYIFREPTRDVAVEYIRDRPQILHSIVVGCLDRDSYVACGNILRNCIRRTELCSILQRTPEMFDLFFAMIKCKDFDVATDGLLSLTMLLTKLPDICSDFMLENYDSLMKTKLNRLLRTRSYVGKRLALSLLSDILMCRGNYHLMVRYVNDAENLEVIVGVFRDKKKSIQLQCFDILKIFVGNPRKSEAVETMLHQCKRTIIRSMNKISQAKPGNERFEREFKMVINVVQQA